MILPAASLAFSRFQTPSTKSNSISILTSRKEDGFFGRHCNIPESVLMAGAGFAQVSAGTSDWDFWFTLYDDPRDSYRLMQGVEIYEESH